jgi:NAD(P)H-hydrate epimerase
MIEIDRVLMEDYGMDAAIMLENAGRCLAVLARELLGKEALNRKIACLAGKGNNAAGGLAASRQLHNWGANIDVIMAYKRDEMNPQARKQVDILDRMGLPLMSEYKQSLEGYDLLIDALLGYSVKGEPKEPIATIIRNANASGTKILSLDMPSGLDPNTGKPGNPTIRATVTMTIALPKKGFASQAAKTYLGTLYVADISMPRGHYVRLGVDSRLLFSRTFIARLKI